MVEIRYCDKFTPIGGVELARYSWADTFRFLGNLQYEYEFINVRVRPDGSVYVRIIP